MRCYLAIAFSLILLVACGNPAPVAPDARGGAEQNTVEAVLTPAETASATAIPATATATGVPPTETATPSASATATAMATATAEVSGLFQFAEGAENSIVVRRNASGGWDNTYINPGAMLYHDGRFHMFRNGFAAWPGEISIGYMNSDDGREWRSQGASPLFTSAAIPYAAGGAAANAVVVARDGTWMLYFHTLTRPYVIGRATAQEPEGPWTPDPQPVLTPGGEGAWDEGAVGWHSVVKSGDGYVMYYAGRQQFTTLIGRATSADGITWTKYDDPETTAPPFAESDPVFTATEDWTGGDIDRPEVLLTPDGWVMLYAGNDLNSRGLALSQDGINWTAAAENPVMTSRQFPIPGTTWDTSLLYHEDIYYYFMEIGSMAGTDIYVATHQGSIHP